MLTDFFADLFAFIRSRNEMRKKGVLAPKHSNRGERFGELLDRSPVAGLFMLIMVWIFSYAKPQPLVCIATKIESLLKGSTKANAAAAPSQPNSPMGERALDATGFICALPQSPHP